MHYEMKKGSTVETIVLNYNPPTNITNEETDARARKELQQWHDKYLGVLPDEFESVFNKISKFLREVSII